MVIKNATQLVQDITKLAMEMQQSDPTDVGDQNFTNTGLSHIANGRRDEPQDVLTHTCVVSVTADGGEALMMSLAVSVLEQMAPTLEQWDGAGHSFVMVSLASIVHLLYENTVLRLRLEDAQS